MVIRLTHGVGGYVGEEKQARLGERCTRGWRTGGWGRDACEVGAREVGREMQARLANGRDMYL